MQFYLKSIYFETDFQNKHC